MQPARAAGAAARKWPARLFLCGANVVAQDQVTFLFALMKPQACCLSGVMVETDRQYRFLVCTKKLGPGELQYESLCI